MFFPPISFFSYNLQKNYYQMQQSGVRLHNNYYRTQESGVRQTLPKPKRSGSSSSPLGGKPPKARNSLFRSLCV